QAVVHFDLVVVLGIGESQWQDALLLQIRLVDTRKTLGNDRADVQEARRHRGVLPAAALTVILVAAHNRPDPFRLVGAGDLRNRLIGFTRQHVGAFPRL